MISVSKFLRKVAVTSRNIADIDYLLACILFIPTFHPPAESWPGTLIHLDLKYMRSSDLRHWGRCENICAGHTMRLSDTLSESLWCSFQLLWYCCWTDTGLWTEAGRWLWRQWQCVANESWDQDSWEWPARHCLDCQLDNRVPRNGNSPRNNLLVVVVRVNVQGTRLDLCHCLRVTGGRSRESVWQSDILQQKIFHDYQFPRQWQGKWLGTGHGRSVSMSSDSGHHPWAASCTILDIWNFCWTPSLEKLASLQNFPIFMICIFTFRSDNCFRSDQMVEWKM